MKKFVCQTCEWDEYKVVIVSSEDRRASCRLYVYNDEPEVAVLCDLYVDKELRGHGKACAMLNGCKDIAREMGCKKMHLRSDTDDWVRQWYRRIGFKDISSQVWMEAEL